jgi:hypothetical protein
MKDEMTDHGHLPDDLAAVARQLESERPQPTGSELERVRQRAMAGEAGSKRNRKVRPTMKPRLAMLSLLAVGILLMGTGTGLAISGISGSGDSSAAEYPTTTTTGTTTTQSTTTQPTSNVAGTTAQGGGGGGGGGNSAQEPRQVAAVATTSSGNSLPFTGFAAIPVILIGVGLLVGGLVMRRRSSFQP